jgi:acyl-CoA synthetase (NDP forming)
MHPRSDLDAFFHPRSVAIVGSVDRNANPERLRRYHDERWGTKWYLVNARGGSVGDIPIYEHVTDIPDEVTLVVINVGPRLVPEVMKECAKHGVRYALIFTAGFSEVGGEGVELERQVGEIARRHGIRVFGPNTNTNAFERIPDPPRVRGGRIGLVTQSGHQGRPIVQGTEFGIAFSRWVPTGNELDLEAADFIEYFAYDPDTSVIAGYFEGFRDPAKLRRALEAANANDKPVVAIKIGATAAGERMAQSHTGHLTGRDAVVEGLFRQHAVTRVGDLDELLECAALFAKLPRDAGTRCCLYSISGGSGALMAEVAERMGVRVPELAPSTQAGLRELIPYYLTVRNPVDNGAQFLLAAPEADRRRVFELIASDPSVDLIVVGLTGALGRLTDRFAEDVVAFADELGKPVVVTWNSFKTDERGFRLLVESGLPLFRSFRGCFAAIAAFEAYRRARSTFRTRTPLLQRPTGRRRQALDAAHAEVGEAIAQGGGPRVTLGWRTATELLRAFGVPVLDDAVVHSPAEAAAALGRFGPPVAMKVASVDIPHKSDAGLVELNVSSRTRAKAAYLELAARADALRARVEGIVVQPQVEPGVEMIVGAIKDPVLGPAVLVGSGGLLAEVLEDVAVRPLPIDRRDAEEMVASLRARRVLEGARGTPRADVRALVATVLAVARLAASLGDRLVELDVNPVVVWPRGAAALDALVVLGATDDPEH